MTEREGEPIELGPGDFLQESEATEIITATAASLSAAGTLYMAYRASRGESDSDAKQVPEPLGPTDDDDEGNRSGERRPP